MTREQRKKQLKGNIQLTVILIMYMWMVSAILIRLLELNIIWYIKYHIM